MPRVDQILQRPTNVHHWTSRSGQARAHRVETGVPAMALSSGKGLAAISLHEKDGTVAKRLVELSDTDQEDLPGMLTTPLRNL
eukprot:766457-Hanusia_phi.AAC.6